MASRVHRVRAIALATGVSTLIALMAAATALAGGGVGPFPK